MFFVFLRLEIDGGIAAALRTSDNPLMVLFTEFGQFLSDNWRLRLLRSAAFEAAKRFPKVVLQVFSNVNDELLSLESKSLKVLNELRICEKSINQLVLLKQAGHSENKIYRSSINEIYKLLGEVQARSLWIEFRLREFRILFENLSLLESRESFAECREFENSYDSFMVCQGRAIELQNRIYTLKEACNHFNLTAGTEVPDATPFLSRAATPKTTRANTAASIGDTEAGDQFTENSSMLSEAFKSPNIKKYSERSSCAVDDDMKALKDELDEAKDVIYTSTR